MDFFTKKITRRDFLKTGILAAGAITIRPWENWSILRNEFPDAEKLGRNCTEGFVQLFSKPDENSTVIDKVYEDSVVVWLREVVGEAPAGVYSRRWVETPNGYLFAPNIQPVKNIINKPYEAIPVNPSGAGFWAEVSIPYMDITFENKATSWAVNSTKPRLYYSQVLWIDTIRRNESGQVEYRVNEKYGNEGDIYWGSGEGFRPITAEEIAPIHPDAGDKKIVVDINHQVLSCYEGKSEVYFCRISSGYQGNDKYTTPLGEHWPWRKLIALRMSGSTTGAGWDTPGIAWTTMFDPGGASIHSTFWHNDFGTPRSHGCVNALPDDSKWVFRWGLPTISLAQDNIEISGPGGTVVSVVDDK
jgi:lipoprotein-anchoring transpeptidase ErfK/SrfK